MRYSLLNFAVCQACHGDLTCISTREIACETSAVVLSPCARVSPSHCLVGPTPTWRRETSLTRVLTSLASAPASPDRNFLVVLDEGLLVCGECGRWYPVTGCVPEILPDHLRDWRRDRALLADMSTPFPAELTDRLSAFQPPAGAGSSNPGEHHKVAEISLPAKISDDSFWGPGYSAPFNLWNPEHTWHLIRNFSLLEPLLELRRGDLVVDMGCGYSWTTEWLLRSGYEPVGFDICRAYLEIALRRIGANRPHLFVADVENLPLRDDIAHGVLAFEAFHHIPDRARAMRELGRILRLGSSFALAEPSSAHDHSEPAVHAMEKFGTLEKGMDLEDVRQYAHGSSLTLLREHFVVRLTAAELGTVDQVQARQKSCVPNNIMTLKKTVSASISTR